MHRIPFLWFTATNFVMIRRKPITRSTRHRQNQRRNYTARISRRCISRYSLECRRPRKNRVPTSRYAHAHDQPQQPLPLVSLPQSISPANFFIRHYTQLLLSLHTPRISFPLAAEATLLNAFWKSIAQHPWVEPWFRRHEAGILIVDPDMLPCPDAGVAGALLSEFCAELLAREDAVALHARCVAGGPLGGARGVLRSLVLQLVCHLAQTGALDWSEVGEWMSALTTGVAGVREMEDLIKKLIARVEKGRTVCCFVSGTQGLESDEAKTVLNFFMGLVGDSEAVVKVIVLGGDAIKGPLEESTLNRYRERNGGVGGIVWSRL